jgi:hypothetical protein
MALLPKTCPACGQPSLIYGYDGATCSNCHAYKQRLTYFQHAVVWAREHSTGYDWFWRLIILAGFGYIFLGAVGKLELESVRNTPLGLFDLGIHELGHIIFIPFGEFMTIAGGSIFQCLFPLLWLAVCMRKRWHFAASMMLVWFAYNLFDVAVYAADARARVLPLATFSNDYDSAHDWYQLLSRTGKLQYDTAIAHGLQVAGTICGFVGLAIGAILILIMFGSWFGHIGKKPDTSTLT